MVTINSLRVVNKKAGIAMKKLMGLVAIAIAGSGGGYLFVANKAQTAAEEAITEINREIEKNHTRFGLHIWSGIYRCIF